MSDTTLAHEPTQRPSAALALARMTDEQFKQQMVMFQKGRDRLQQVMRAMMTDGVHYGKIPGTGDKPTLLQPGADLLLKMFGLVAEPSTEITYGDGVTSPHFTIKARCLIRVGDLDGPVVAVGEAAANSWEKKWRWRNADKICPACGKPTIIKGKAEYGGGWICYPRKGGCNAKYQDGDQSIEGQQTGQIENPDPFEILNTAVKIANKRAKVHATIAATDSSDLLTQDVEESGDHGQSAPEHSQQPHSQNNSTNTQPQEPTFPFGNSKGRRPSDLTAEQLAGEAEFWTGQVNKPDNKFRAANQKLLDAIHAAIASKAPAAAPGEAVVTLSQDQQNELVELLEPYYGIENVDAESAILTAVGVKSWEHIPARLFDAIREMMRCRYDFPALAHGTLGRLTDKGIKLAIANAVQKQAQMAEEKAAF